jgi:hypothetical protein
LKQTGIVPMPAAPPRPAGADDAVNPSAATAGRCVGFGAEGVGRASSGPQAARGLPNVVRRVFALPCIIVRVPKHKDFQTDVPCRSGRR